MLKFRAVYRDYVSDRNPVRAEVIFLAADRAAALVEAQRKTTRSFELIEVVQEDGEFAIERPEEPSLTLGEPRAD